MVYKHLTKASEITEQPLTTSAGGGLWYELYGPVPAPVEVFLTDSSRYAVLASCYFRTALRNDSLAPVIGRMKADLAHAMHSLRWE